MHDATLAGPARLGASRTPGTEAEDAITVAREEEENGGWIQRRIRKPSAKARQNEIVQDGLDAALLSSAKQNRSAARGTITNDTQARTSGKGSENVHATMQTLQEQMNKQTEILNIILEAWTRQETHNKALQAELGHIKDELQAVKEECQAAKEECQAAKEECQAIKNELHRTQQQVEDGIAALASGQGSPRPSYADVARTHRIASQAIYGRSHPDTRPSPLSRARSTARSTP